MGGKYGVGREKEDESGSRGNGRKRELSCGCGACLLNVSPEGVYKYRLYDGRTVNKNCLMKEAGSDAHGGVKI